MIQDYPTIHDTEGEQIHPGSIVKPWRGIEGDIEMPGGVVTKLDEMDVDVDDEGVACRYGPFVHVTHDDGTEERYDVIDVSKAVYMAYDYEWVCEEVEVEPRPDAEAMAQSCGEANRQAAEGAAMIRHAEWLESEGRHDEAADIRRDYPF